MRLLLCCVGPASEMPWNLGKIWHGKTNYQDTDVVPGWFSGCFDCMYWSFSVYTTFIDKAPRTWGGKLVMLGHGFYMLIMISSYVANLASVLSQRDTSMDFSGWYEGKKPVIARIEDIHLAIGSGSSQVKFIQQEEVAEGRKFMKIDCYDTWQESMDSVLCGEAPAAFHDEAMVLHYLTDHLPAFTRGEYTPSIGNCDTTRNPHELKSWGIGKKYVWGPPGSTGHGSRECSLAVTGDVFHSTSYSFAFGYDHAASIPFSEAILFLRDSHNPSHQDA